MNCQQAAELTSLYLSRELDAPRSLELDQHLHSCPACLLTITRLAANDTLLRDAVLAETIDTTDIDRQVRHLIRADQSKRRRLWAYAAVAASFAILFLAYALIRQPLPTLYANAAQDHHREVIEAQPRNWLTDPAAIESLAIRLDVPTSALAKLAPPQHQLRQGKFCRLDGRLFLHLVYSNGSSRVSVFLQKPDAAPAPLPASQTINGHACWKLDFPSGHLAAFQTKSLVALLVATEPDAAWNYARSAANAL